FDGAGPDARQVGARTRLAHADAEERLAAADRWQVELLLRFGAVLQDQRRALPVRNPMRSNRCAEVEEFFHHHIAGIGAAAAAAIRLGQRDAQPALLAEFATEGTVIA